jgi:hypothetical protein
MGSNSSSVKKLKDAGGPVTATPTKNPKGDKAILKGTITDVAGGNATLNLSETPSGGVTVPLSSYTFEAEMPVAVPMDDTPGQPEMIAKPTDAGATPAPMAGGKRRKTSSQRRNQQKKTRRNRN